MGEVYESLPFEISSVSRKVINLGQFGVPADSVIEIVSSEPVLVERYIGSGTGWLLDTGYASIFFSK